MNDDATVTLPEGYESWDGTDPFEDYSGPYFFKRMNDGTIQSAFVSKPHHCNGGGYLHGGSLMTFADYSLFVFAKDITNGPCVTVSFNSDFVSAGRPNKLIEARGSVVRNTRSLIFVRGEVFCGDEIILPFNGVIKRIGV